MNPEIEHHDGAPLWQRDTYDTAGETRNICAMIPVSLFNEIERLSMCSVSASGQWSKWLSVTWP